MVAAVLSGTVLEPALLVRPPYAEQDLRAALKRRPGCKWDDESKAWRVTDPCPRAALSKLRLTLDQSRVGFTVEEATAPLVLPHPNDRHLVLINPRLSGADHVTRQIAPMATPDPVTGWVVADILCVAGQDGRPLPGLVMDQRVRDQVEAAWASRVAQPRSWMRPDPDAVLLGRSYDPDDPDVAEALARQEARHPVPGWFGLDLYPYQRIGAQAVVAGHRLLADEMGLGKTRTVLAAFAALNRQRIVITSLPASLVTVWACNVADAHMARITSESKTPKWLDDPDHPADSPAGQDARLVVVRPGVKQPALPDRGVVIVADSLLASRPALIRELVDWAPDGVAYDEAHRGRSWGSRRSQAIRGMIEQVRAATGDCVAIASTGTPSPSSSPVDYAPVLGMLGMLDPVWAGLGNFTRRYAKPKFFGGFEADPEQAGRLRKTLDLWVRTRRLRADVQPWMPKKTRLIVPVEADQKVYREWLGKVDDRVLAWAEEFIENQHRAPTAEDVHDWATRNTSMQSALRIAAAMAKTEWCADLVRSRLDEQTPVAGPDGRAVWSEPQLVWCWHKDVMREVADRISAHTHPSGEPYQVEVLNGETPSSRRDQIVRDIQNRTAPVTVCQISSVGVALTLTACHSPIFLETDWLPDLNEQAEARCHRNGQEEPVEVTIGWAPDTTDDHLFASAAKKARTTRLVSPAGADADEPWPGPDIACSDLLTEHALLVLRKRGKLNIG